MRAKEDIVSGLNGIRSMLKKQAENGLYENIINEVEDMGYKKRTKKSTLQQR